MAARSPIRRAFSHCRSLFCFLFVSAGSDVSMTDNAFALMAMPVARHSADGQPFGGGGRRTRALSSGSQTQLRAASRAPASALPCPALTRAAVCSCTPSLDALSPVPPLPAVDWLTGGTPCYSMYRTRDGFISVGSLEPKFWASFCAAVGLDALVAAQFPEGAAEVAAVKAQVQAVLEQRTSQEWKEHFAKRDCCVEIGPSQRDEERGRKERHAADAIGLTGLASLILPDLFALSVLIAVLDFAVHCFAVASGTTRGSSFSLASAGRSRRDSARGSARQRAAGSGQPSAAHGWTAAEHTSRTATRTAQ